MQYKNVYAVSEESSAPVSLSTSSKIWTQNNVVYVTADATIGEVVNLMRQHHIGDVVVVEKNEMGTKPIGIVTDRDILLKTYSSKRNYADLDVIHVMSPFLATAHIDDDVFKMIGQMNEEGVSRLPLVDNGGYLCGIVTAKKLYQHLLGSLIGLAGISDQQRSNERVMKH